MAKNTVYLIFHGFPGDLDPKTKKYGMSPRKYNGTNPQTRGWAPGEVRALTDEVNPSKPDELTFNAEAAGERLVADYGQDSDAFSHYPKRGRKMGFAVSDKAAADAWKKSVKKKG